MKEVTDLREIMDEFTEVGFCMETLIMVLHMLESYCEIKEKDDAMAIAIVMGKQLAMLQDDLKETITKLDMYIISNRRKYQI